MTSEIAGFDPAEADLLRRAMSHFDPGKRMQELKRSSLRRQMNEMLFQLILVNESGN